MEEVRSLLKATDRTRRLRRVHQFAPMEARLSVTISLASISIYPIKSSASLPLNAADVGAHGLAGDRRWMVVDHHGGLISAREHPRLVLLSAHPVAEGGLAITAPDRPPIEIKVSDNAEVKVCGGSRWDLVFPAIPSPLPPPR